MRLVRAAVCSVVVVWLAGSAAAFAQEIEQGAAPGASAVAVPQLEVVAAAPAPPQLVWRQAPEPRRPAALLPLYGSLGALQALDIYTTRVAVTRGQGREANPAMKSVVRNGPAFVALKMASTAGVMWMTEKMWKRHPRRAVVMAAAVNGALAAIVVNNYRVRR